MNKKKKFSKSAFLICLSMGLVCAAMVFIINHMNKHETLTVMLDSLTGDADQTIVQNLDQIYGLQAMIVGSDGAVTDLEAAGPFLVRNECVKYVLVAPVGVVSSVYPFSGNEKLIGNDLYASNEQIGQDVLANDNSFAIVITGPYEDTRGDMLLTGSARVFIQQKDTRSMNWGLVSVTLDFKKLMEKEVLEPLSQAGFACRVLMVDEEIGETRELSNIGFSHGNDSESARFSVGDSEFVLEAYPQGGWYNYFAMGASFLAVFTISAVVAHVVPSIIRSRRNLRVRATTDELTGVLNRRGGIERMRGLLNGENSSGGAFVLIDIDYFKNVNDTLSHQTGDAVLKETGGVLKMICRGDDVVCRLGGDEFFVFFPSVNPREFILDKAGQMNRAMCREVSSSGKSVKISCSIGIAIAPADGMDFFTLYEKADVALYRSKEKGRNCATFFGEN